MYSKLRGKLSYANVVASLALFIALGGGAYAAATLPKNSVGSAQIKKNAVTSAKLRANAVSSGKVKDGSLLKKDFKAGELPAGATGATGAKGDKGDTGAAGTNGTNGSTGPRGPSNGFESGDNASAAVGAGNEDTILLPAGNFLVMAKADVENGGAAGAGTVTCQLEVPGGFPVDSSTVKLPADGVNDDEGFALHAQVVLASAGSVAFDCSQVSTGAQLTNLKMNAIQLETMSFEEVVR